MFCECLSRTIFIGIKSWFKKGGKQITKLEYKMKPK